MKEMSVDELCALVQRLGVGFCADVFKKKEVDGAEMIYMSKAGFVCLLVEAGATNFTSGNLFRWQLLSPLSLRFARLPSIESLGPSPAASRIGNASTHTYASTFTTHFKEGTHLHLHPIYIAFAHIRLQ